MKNTFLILAVIALLFSGIFGFVRLNAFNTSLTEWTNNLSGSGYWLRPDNKNIKKTTVTNIYEGEAVILPESTEDQLVLSVYNDVEGTREIVLPTDYNSNAIFKINPTDIEKTIRVTLPDFIDALRAAAIKTQSINVIICINKEIDKLEERGFICELSFESV